MANESTPGSDLDIVNFPVQKKYVSEVTLALARIIEADRAGAPALVTPPVVGGSPWWPPEGKPEDLQIDWDMVKLKELRRRLSNPNVLALLDMAAGRPNDRIYIEDVMEATGCSHGQASAGLAVLTKTIRKMLRVRDRGFNWPAPFHWDAEKQRAYYSMTNSVSAAWQAARVEESAEG